MKIRFPKSNLKKLLTFSILLLAYSSYAQDHISKASPFKTNTSTWFGSEKPDNSAYNIGNITFMVNGDSIWVFSKPNFQFDDLSDEEVSFGKPATNTKFKNTSIPDSRSSTVDTTAIDAKENIAASYNKVFLNRFIIAVPGTTITGTFNICFPGTTQLTGSGTPNASNPWVSSNPAVATVSNTGLVTGIGLGTTTITYTDSLFNNASQNVTVTAYPTITGTLVRCAGGTTQLTGTGTPAAINPWVSSNPAVATVSNTGLVSGVSGGTTTITYKNSFGCSTTANVTINPLLIPTITCGTTTTTQITFNWSSIPGATTYTVGYNVNGTGNIFVGNIGNVLTYTKTGLNPGDSVVITVTPSGAVGTCFATGTRTCAAATCTGALIPPTPVTTVTQPTCTTSTGSISITPVTGLTYSFDASPYSTTLLYPGLAAGSSHTITSKNTDGCISPVVTITLISQPLTPTAPVLSATHPTCTVATGSVTITGVAGETYSLDTNPYSATLVYSGLAAGSSHTVTAKNSDGCISAVSNITLNAQPPTPATPVVAVSQQPTCTVATGEITITAVAGLTYSFDTNPYSTTLVYSGLAAGSTHTVTAKNADGCISAVSTITLNAQPLTPAAPALSATQPTCTVATGSISIIGVAGETYSFDTSPYSATLVYSGLAAGSTHTVTAMNADGCISAVSTITLNVQPLTPAAPVLSATQPTCTVATGSISITAVAGLTYSFDTNPYSATLVYSGLTAGSTHTVTAKNSDGCISAVSTITLNAQPLTPSAPVLTATQPTCTVATGSISITGIAGLTYSFDTNPYSATLVYSGLTAGSTHTVTAKNSDGCISVVATITLSAQPLTPAAPSLSATQPTCTVATGSISITGVAGETYSLDTNPYSATLVYSGLIAGSTHTVTAKNADGCISAVSTITLNAQPLTPAAPALSATQATCTVATGSVTITGVAGETYSFDTNPYSATLVYSGLAAGSTHTVTSKNSDGCISAISTITLNAQPLTPSAPVLTATQPTCTVATGSVTITGVAGETYSFDTNPYSATLVYSGLTAGSTHTVTAKNADGCISAVSTITLNTQPLTPAAPVLTATQPTCTVATGSITITGVAGETYSLDTNPYSATLVYSGLTAGSTHTVTAKNSDGCISAVSTITLNVQPLTPAAPALSATQPTCTLATGEITITPIAGLTYSFDTNPYSATLVYSGLTAGSTHTVTAKNADGCISAIATITLNAQPLTPAAPALSSTQPTCTVATGSITITGVTGETYSFDTNPYSATLVYSGLTAGSTHTVTAKNSDGCISVVATITLSAQPLTPAAPSLSATQPTCTVATGSISITGVAGETYSLDTNPYSATLVYSGLAAGSTHTVTAKNSDGCISAISTITLNAQPLTPSAPVLTATQPTCTVATGSISITGVAGETYSLDTNPYSATLVYSGLAAGSTHTVTAKNADGCISAVSTITLNVQPLTPAAPALSATQPTCTVSTGIITITGVAGETYSLDTNPYSATLVYSGLTAGSTHTVTAKNADGCISAVTTITLNAQPLTPAAPALSATQPTCTVATGEINITPIAGLTYSFDTNPYSATLVYSGLTAGSTHTITAKNSDGCISAVSTITLNAQPLTPAAPALTPTQPTCTVATGSVTITGVAGETYSFDTNPYSATLVYSGLAAGSTHTVTAMNADGCISAVSTITLNAQPLTPAAPALSATQPTCTVSTGIITITGAAGETYSLDTNPYSATLVYSGLIAGSTHTVTAKNADGCISAVSTIILNVQPLTPAAPVLTATQPTCTVATGSITITAVAGETYSFDTNPYSATLVYSGLIAGSTHTVTAKNADGCISAVSTITLNAQPLTPAAPALSATQPTCTVATGSISIIGVAGETYSFDTSPYSATLVYSGLAAGSTHTVTALNADGCISAVSTITLNAQPLTPAAPVLSSTQPTCTVATGSITITGVTGETYSLDTNPYSATLVYSGLAAGSTHTVTAKNSDGCISAISTITLNAQPLTPSAPVLTATQPTCTVATGSVTITGVAGLTYSFDTNPYSATLVYSGLIAGSTHTVTAKNADGCISAVSTITLNAQPLTPAAPALSATQPTCTVSTGIITITGAAGETYSLDTNPYSATLVYSGLAAGSTHTVTAMNADGCISAVSTITLNAQPLTPSAPVLTATQPTCTVATGSITITGVAGETYSLDTNPYSATLVYSGLIAGSTHTVTAKNADGCISAVSTITLNAQPLTPAAPALSATQPTCTVATGSVTITGVAGETYSLDTNPYSATLVYSGLTPGSTHTVTAKNADGCISAVSTITLNTQPLTPAAPALSATQPTCTVATGEINITPIAGLTYSFDTNPYSATLVYSGLTAGSTHTITAKNSDGCISAVSTITLNAQPLTPAAPALTPTQPTCTVATGSVTITGVAGETYSFDTNPYSATLVYSGLTAGSTHTVTAKNAAGCISAVSTITLNVQPLTPAAPALSATQPTCTVSTGIITITGVAGETYSLDTNPYSATLVYSGLTAGSTHTVTAKNADGCISAVTTITLNAQPLTPIVSVLPATQSICSGESTNITLSDISAGTTFDWTVVQTNVTGAVSGSGNSIVQTLDATGTVVGTVIYTVTPTGTNGCIGNPVNITITVNPLPLPAITDGIICVDATGTTIKSYILNTGLNNSTHDFVWSLNGGIISGTDSTLEATVAGDYTVIATNTITGCISLPVSAIVSESLQGQTINVITSEAFSDNPLITVNVLPANSDYIYQLDGGVFQSSNVFSEVAPGLHSIIVQDSNGCTNLTEEVLLINYPKYFTPNGDGVNETWNIIGLENQSAATIYIFDRYGKLIKQISPSGMGWDGTLNGQPLPGTDYWFTAEYVENLQKRTFKSHFALKR